MERRRQAALDRAGEGLTAAEWAAGWHWCSDWDFLLVGPGTPEADACTCAVHQALLARGRAPDADA